MPTRPRALTAKRARVLPWLAVAVAALNVPIQFWDHSNERSPWMVSSGLAAVLFCFSLMAVAFGTRVDSGRAKRVVVILQWVLVVAFCGVVLSRLLRH
jgi:hypothetical protein